MEPDQSGKTISFQSFKKDLYMIDVPLINFTRGLGPSFGKLQREIRDQIFSDLIASGHPQFMSVSQVINTEGKALIYKKGVFKIRFDFDTFKFKREVTFGKHYLPNANILDKLQNLSIRIRSRCDPSVSDMYRYARDFSCLLNFKASHLTRGNRTIVFKLSPYGASSLLLAFAGSLEGLTDFDAVVISMEFDLDAITWFPEDRIRELIELTKDSCFSVMQADFEPHLGKGEMELDSDGLRMIFHPREA